MAITSTVTISGGTVGGSATNQTIGPVNIVNSSGVNAITTLILASGDNTIAVPKNALACIITPDPANTSALKFKGVGGDTGVAMNKTQPCEFTFDPSSTAGGTYTFIINSAGAGVNPTNIAFF